MRLLVHGSAADGGGVGSGVVGQRSSVWTGRTRRVPRGYGSAVFQGAVGKGLFGDGSTGGGWQAGF